jgi:hypothetical protein
VIRQIRLRFSHMVFASEIVVLRTAPAVRETSTPGSATRSRTYAVLVLLKLPSAAEPHELAREKRKHHYGAGPKKGREVG